MSGADKLHVKPTQGPSVSVKRGLDVHAHKSVISALRRAIIACLTIALAFMGLVAQPAMAATSGSVSGSGTGLSKKVTLDKGIYTVDFAFSGNSDVVDAWLRPSKAEDDHVAWSDEGSGKTRRIVQLLEKDVLRFDVVAPAGTKWSAKVTRAKVPETSRRSILVSHKGLESSEVHLLQEGTYTFTASYSGNVEEDGHGRVSPYDISLFVMEANGGRREILHAKSSGSGTKAEGTFVLKERGYVWINPEVGPKATWSVEARLPPLKDLTATPKPKISGTAQVGKTLTVKPGTWKPSGVTFSYQWLRDGKPIEKKAKKETYVPTAADLGKKLSVQITSTKLDYRRVTKVSSKTKAVTIGTLTETPTPRITGSMKVGKTVTARTGSWRPTKVTFTFQWYRDGKSIKGATKQTYKLTKSDKGKTISVKVKGKNPGFTSVTKTSKKTVKIK